MNEPLELLREWQAEYEQCNTVHEELLAVGFDIEAPICKALWHLFDAYEDRIAAVVGDGRPYWWLAWFRDVCRMGQTPRTAGPKDRTRLISSFEDLLWLIEATK